MKKTFLTLAIGLVATAALVGCGAEQPTTVQPVASTTTPQTPVASTTEAASTPYTSADGTFSCTIPAGFTQTTNASLSAGSVAFTHPDGRALAITTSSSGITDLSTLTQDNLTKTMQAQYPDAALSDFTMEGVDDGTIVSYRLVATINGTQTTLAQVTYVNANRKINFTLTGSDANAADLNVLKQVVSSLKLNS